MLAGVYEARKKDGSVYYRSSITFRNKHISLGSFENEDEANAAYLEAERILFADASELTIHDLLDYQGPLGFEKAVSLVNFRDKGVYIKNPIYLFSNYFVYYLSPEEELKFDIEDLFYYSGHKIIKRGGHLYVNDYGMQVNLLSRYEIKNYAVAGKDYIFRNGDATDFRYGNIEILNPYFGVFAVKKDGKLMYRTKVHLHGMVTVGTYDSEIMAALAYNKALDLLKSAGIERNFQENYIDLKPREYAEMYTEIRIAKGFLKWVEKNR